MNRIGVFERATWECVHFVAFDQLPPTEELARTGLRIFAIQDTPVESEADLFAAVSAAMEFPDYFGANWDAMDECLRDLDWLPARGYLLSIHNAEDLWRRHPRLMGEFVQSWLFAAETWGKDSKPFHLVFVW